MTHSAVSHARRALAMTVILTLGGCSSPFHEVPMSEATAMNASETEIRAAALLSAADAEIDKRNWVVANQLLKDGLAAIGTSYQREDTIDETGTRLMLADVEEKKGSLQQAATLRRRVCADRLALLRAKTGSPR